MIANKISDIYINVTAIPNGLMYSNFETGDTAKKIMLLKSLNNTHFFGLKQKSVENKIDKKLKSCFFYD